MVKSVKNLLQSKRVDLTSLRGALSPLSPTAARAALEQCTAARLRELISLVHPRHELLKREGKVAKRAYVDAMLDIALRPSVAEQREQDASGEYVALLLFYLCVWRMLVPLTPRLCHMRCGNTTLA